MRTAALAMAMVGSAALLAGLVRAPASPVAGHDDAFTLHHVPALLPAGVGGKYNQNGGNWSGVVTNGSGFNSVTATWTQPSVTCSSSHDLYAPWVGIDGYGSNSVEQTGVATDCSSGSPVNQGWYEMYPAKPVYYDNPVHAGDHITATVHRSGDAYTLTLSDISLGWTRTVTQYYGGANVSAEIILESPTSAYPNFGTVNVTGATIDGASLSSFNLSYLDARNNSGTEDHTSALGSDGQSFSVTYEQE